MMRGSLQQCVLVYIYTCVGVGLGVRALCVCMCVSMSVRISKSHERLTEQSHVENRPHHFFFVN